MVHAGPARTLGPYQSKADRTAETVDSYVQTALLSIELADNTRVNLNTLSVQLDDAATGASGAHNSFDTVEPPSEIADQLQEQLDRLLSQVDGQLSALATDAHRHHISELAQHRQPLQDLSQQIKQLENQLS